MIPILYDKSETAFTSNGLGRLADCTSCTVTEERNGIYECQFTYPVTGEMYPLIQEGQIIGVIHDDVKDIQPFDIYGRSAPLNGVVTFYAHHISYRLGNIILKPMTAASCVDALNMIPNKTYTECPFTFWTDKSVSATWKNEVPNPVKAILGGQRGSILDVYGKGEYEFDKWLVRLYVNRGVDNGVSIRYGVNLTDLQHDTDTSGIYTAVVPFWKSADDDIVVTLDTGYVNVLPPVAVPWTDDHGEAITDDQGRVIYFNTEDSSAALRSTVMDLSDAFEEQPTQAQLRAEALRRATNSEAWLPSENIKVSFVDLAHTEEYKTVAALQRVRLCDRVSVYCGPLGVSAVSMQVIRVVFNVLTERYDEIELGKAKTSFASTVMKDVTETVNETVENIKGITASAIDKATKQITGENGGHVRFVYDANGDPQEILIMDTEDINTAVNVWRWNSGGLGFSSNGYAGPYNTAMTADGQIVADMITVGSLSANLLKSGVIDGDVISVKLLKIINNANEVLATFNNVITIGRNRKARAIIGYNYFNFVDSLGNVYFKVNDPRDENSLFEYSETLTAYTNEYHIAVVETKYKIAGGSTSDFPNYIKDMTINGNAVNPQSFKGFIYTYTIAGDIEYSQIRGYDMGITRFSAGDVIEITYYSDTPKYNYDLGKRKAGTERGSYSVVSGSDCSATGLYAIALGIECGSYGTNSFSHGRRNAANGTQSYAIGVLNTANGVNSFVAGYNNTANGTRSFVLGNNNIANGENSFVAGNNNIANGNNQFVFGYYNIESDYHLEVVGNGFVNRDGVHRNNARVLTNSGNEWLNGSLFLSADSQQMIDVGNVPKVSSIRAHYYRWNPSTKWGEDNRRRIGYYAQDVEGIIPDLVYEDDRGYKALDYIGLLCAKVDALEQKVADLQQRVTELEKE